MQSLDLSKRAMLADLTIRQWSARRHDRRVSAEVARSHGASERAGRYNKCLIDPIALRPISRAASAARAEFYRQTLPWTNDGARILAVQNMQACTDAMRTHRDAFEDAVRDFLPLYPGHVNDARTALNGMFDPREYPTAQAISAKFSFALGINPMPAAQDFRVNLSCAQLDMLKRGVESQAKTAAAAAARECWQRVHDTVQRVSERLSKFDPAQPKAAPFRDSLIRNVTELADLLPRLNLTDDPALNRMADTLRDTIARHDAQELRDSDFARQSTKQAADAILDSLAGYVS